MQKHLLTAALVAACVSINLTAVAAESGNTTVGGKAYLDITNISKSSDGQKTDPSGIGADGKRFYLGVNHVFDNMFSANLTTDFKYDSGKAQATQLYVKKAYLQVKFSDAAVLRIGSADLPWVPFAEHMYGYRYVENVLIDRLKFGTSADWGLHLKGKLLNNSVQYALSMVNGNGYKNPSRSKSMDIEGRISATPVKNLTLAAGFYSGKLGQETQAISTATNTATRVNFLADYRFSIVNVGAEYFSADNYTKTAVKTGPSDKATGYSAWVTVKPAKKIAVFARYDHAQPSKDLNSSLKDTYYNLGVSYQARKNVDLALVYKHDKVENGSINTSNGKIGGVNEGKYDEIGLWAQVKF